MLPRTKNRHIAAAAAAAAADNNNNNKICDRLE